MVGANVTAMEEQVTQAEGELGTLPSAFKKIFRNMSVPNFLNVSVLQMSICFSFTCPGALRTCFIVIKPPKINVNIWRKTKLIELIKSSKLRITSAFFTLDEPFYFPHLSTCGILGLYSAIVYPLDHS